MKLKTRALTLAATAFAVTACGGGGNNGSMPTPQNAAPTLAGFSAVTTNQDTPTSTIGFTVNDDGGVAGVTLTATSRNPEIIAQDGIQLGGSGTSRTLMLRPSEDATGNAIITVTATDSQGLKTETSFGVNVVAVQKSVASYTNSTFGLGENDSPQQVSGFTFVQDADAETTFDPLLQ